MPVVHIFTTAADRNLVRGIADGIHQAMVETIGIPVADRFQALHRLDPDDLIFDAGFLGVQRSSGFLLIEITLAAGRDVAVKERLYGRIAELLEPLGCRPADIFIVLREVGVADFSLGMGEAQFVRALPPHLQALQPERLIP